MDSEAAGLAFLSREQIIRILSEVPAGFIKPTDPPAPSLPPFKKLGVLVDIDDIVGEQDAAAARIRDNMDKEQSFSCVECRKILPTAHLLDLHITEQHDCYFAASVERGDKPMFSCFLEECTVKFHTARQRKDHCIIAHKLPANYRFDHSKNRGKQKHQAKGKANSMEVDEVTEETKSLPYVKAFSFGHQTQRSFYTRKDQRSGETLDNVQAMKEAINDILD
ncbi:protein lethal(2)k10201 [Drosophila mauritiana]|uniref:Protein lethal(2)k10201 n=1 Tax=Drosophila mauritiana TaxID=7226 RepID=A0A6P8JI41_DROMA|nr:protein lethal(2)k10201 [Drosophila mauritiana]